MRAGRPRSQQSAQENIYVIDDFITGVLHLLQPPETPLPLDGKRHIAFAQAWLTIVDVAYARDNPPPKVKCPVLNARHNAIQLDEISSLMVSLHPMYHEQPLPVCHREVAKLSPIKKAYPVQLKFVRTQKLGITRLAVDDRFLHRVLSFLTANIVSTHTSRQHKQQSPDRPSPLQKAS
jgi:hypothetical protein